MVFTNPESNAREINSAYNNLIVCYHFDKDENCFFIPKGRINILNKLSYCKEIEFETLDDLRTVGEDIVDFKCNFDFRDEIQKGAFDAYVNNPAKIGIINLACGLGKSFLGMKIIEYVKGKTIILMDEIYLVEQWKEYLLENTNLNPDKLLVLTGKMKKEDKLKCERIEEMDIVIATKGTLVNRYDLIDRMNTTFRLTIVDEVHFENRVH